MGDKSSLSHNHEGFGVGWDSSIWDFYKRLPQFEKIVWSQFEVRLKAHRKQASERDHRSMQEEHYLARDRQLYPRQSHNHRGEPVFDLSPAKFFFYARTSRTRFIPRKQPSELQASREEYKPFKSEKFKCQIYQEVRRSKYIYYLELKRAKQQGRDPQV
jgi:hypothetical protein